MYHSRFDKFTAELTAAMPQLVSEILGATKEKVYAIAFITTDDFYGMYVAFETLENYKKTPAGNKDTYRRWACNEWGYSDAKLPSDFNPVLYKNLVQVAEAYEEPDLMHMSPEKWAYAQAFIHAVGDALKTVPDSIFGQYGYNRADIIFFTTMSDGDYMEEMMKESVLLYNDAAAITQDLLDYIG